MTQHSQTFTDPEIAAVYRAITERRDMRHFAPDPVAPEVLTKLLQAAHHAPSVGLMQPWRFIRITSQELRHQIYELVQAERIKTAEALGQHESKARMLEFMRLKVEGILECGELLVVALCDKREGYIFGRRTLPEMDLASAACAIQNLWLAARAESLGMGWVSMFDPIALGSLLNIPNDGKAIAILCLGHVNQFYAQPMLVEEAWAKEKPLSELMMENQWQEKGE